MLTAESLRSTISARRSTFIRWRRPKRERLGFALGSWNAEESPPPVAPTSGAVVSHFQSHSSRTDSPVRILHAQPASSVSERHVLVALMRASRIGRTSIGGIFTPYPLPTKDAGVLRTIDGRTARPFGRCVGCPLPGLAARWVTGGSITNSDRARTLQRDLRLRIMPRIMPFRHVRRPKHDRTHPGNDECQRTETNHDQPSRDDGNQKSVKNRTRQTMIVIPAQAGRWPKVDGAGARIYFWRGPPAFPASMVAA
jgi:hypothetical protein